MIDQYASTTGIGDIDASAARKRTLRLSPEVLELRRDEENI